MKTQNQKEETDEIYDVDGRLERSLQNLKDASILEGNRQKILEFVNHLLANGTGKNKTSRYLYDLINMGIWVGKPFENADKKDIERVMVMLQNAISKRTNKPYSEWSKRGFRILIRKFYKWLRGTRYFPDEVDWISIKMKENHKKLPEDMLIEDEIEALVNSSTCNRDKAIIMELYDSGCRIKELLTQKVKHVEYCQNGVKVYLKGKTGMRRIILVSSAPYLEMWLNEHPNKEPNSYLWVRKDGKRITYHRVRAILKECALRAGVNKKVNPHNYRHSRASHYANKLTDRQMMEYFGWSRAETVGIYTHLSGRDIDEAILKANGIEVSKEKEKLILKPKKCHRCKKIHEATALYCTCGFPLNEELANKIKVEEMQREKANAVMEKLTSNPKFMELAEKFINEEN